MSKRLILTRGLPGSGKSTFAQSISNGDVFSSDQLFMRLVDNEWVYCFNPNLLHQYHRQNLLNASNAMTIGAPLVIIDNTNTTFKEMKPYLISAINFDYEVEIIEPKTSWKFDVEECFKRNTHSVPKESIQRMLDRWEPTDLCYQKFELLKKAINNVK